MGCGGAAPTMWSAERSEAGRPRERQRDADGVWGAAPTMWSAEHGAVSRRWASRSAARSRGRHTDETAPVSSPRYRPRMPGHESSEDETRSLVVRVWLPDRPGALGQVASRIGGLRGDVTA